jgi:hypothetical protein
MTWTVEPRYSPLRSLRSTAYQTEPDVWFAFRDRFSSMNRS